MSRNLPPDFLRERKPILGAEWEDFLQSYDTPRAYGLRRNPFQGCDTLPFSLKPVAWAEDGYYFDPEERPGRHPLHEAGAYYIQEPSAMSVVSLLDPQAGELVCDLCAAPGGKSTHIAALLRGQGMLVSNEIFPRVLPLTFRCSSTGSLSTPHVPAKECSVRMIPPSVNGVLRMSGSVLTASG